MRLRGDDEDVVLRECPDCGERVRDEPICEACGSDLDESDTLLMIEADPGPER